MIVIYQGTVPVLPLHLPCVPASLGLPGAPGLPADMGGRGLSLVLGILLAAPLAGLHLPGCDQGDVSVPDTDLGNISSTLTPSTPPPPPPPPPPPTFSLGVSDSCLNLSLILTTFPFVWQSVINTWDDPLSSGHIFSIISTFCYNNV